MYTSSVRVEDKLRHGKQHRIDNVFIEEMKNKTRHLSQSNVNGSNDLADYCRKQPLAPSADIILTHGYLLNEDEKEQPIMKPYAPLGILYISA